MKWNEMKEWQIGEWYVYEMCAPLSPCVRVNLTFLFRLYIYSAAHISCHINFIYDHWIAHF